MHTKGLAACSVPLTPACLACLLGGQSLINVIGRLEDMSHVLVWTKTPLRQPNEPCTIDVVELPRLGLTFRAREVGRRQA